MDTYDVDTFGVMPSAGPWTLKGGPDNERYISDVNGQPIILDVEYYPWVTSNDANLVLMAAAADLLEALEYARRFMKSDTFDLVFIDNAINKAKGLTK